MPFKTVSATRKRVPALKSLSDKQVRTFITVFNKLEKSGTKEDSAIPQAIAAAKKVDKSMEIDKATVENKRRVLSDAVTNGFIVDFDLDSNEVFIERWHGDKHRTFRHSFTLTDTSATIEEEGTEVIRTVDFKEVEKSLDAPITESRLMKVLDKFFGSSNRKDSIQVVKQFGTEDEPMFAVEPLYIAPGEVDGHGDTMGLEDITSMVESLNKANEEGRLQSGLFHKHKTDVWTLEKAWVNPVECMIGDQLVPEGQPIAKTLFNNKRAFQMRIEGDISGLSIGARAKGAIDLTKDLSEIQSQPEATRQLVGVNFDWDHPELTYTSPSQGGAASLKNEAYEINKAKKATIDDLDEEQANILKDIGEEFVSLEKHLGVDNTQTPSSSAEAKVGEDNQVIKGNHDTMSDEKTLERIAQLEKALAVSEATNSLTGYSFEADVNKAVAGAIAKLDSAEDKEAIVKAFDALVARTEAEVEKAKADKPEEESDLSKALSEEAGEGGEVEETVEKSLAERALEAQAKMKEAL
jgi:hypothetical protein